MGTIAVRHVDGDRFTITIRSHTLAVDQPIADGGTDTAPTPTELFVASLTSCVAFYARRFLARHQLRADELDVTASYLMGSRPARVSEIVITLDLPEELPADKREALLAVVSHCTVHNTLEDPPVVKIALAAGTAAA